MEDAAKRYFANTYIEYLYGSYIHCDGSWKQYHVICPFHKFYFILDGECEIQMAGEAFSGQKGVLFLIPANCRHSFYHKNDKYITKYWLHCDIRAGSSDFLQSLGLPYYVIVPEDRTKEFSGYFRDIFRLERENSPASQVRVNARIMELLAGFMELSGVEKLSGKSSYSQEFTRLLQYMEEHMGEKLTNSLLAGRLFIHPNYFIRMFKKNMGITPLQYLNRIRTERAKSLLENSDLPVSDIMIQVGIQDLSTFSKYFKHYTGYTPGSFKEMFGTKKNCD